MPFNGFVRFHNLLCEFEKFGLDDFWNTWQWKLDPYLIDSISDASCSLIIRGTGYRNETIFSGTQLLRSEFSGFFQRQVHRSTNAGTIWSFIRTKDESVYLQYAVNNNWDEIILLKDNTKTAGYLAFEYLGQMMPYVLLNHSILTFHGVLMEYKGCGIIISAPSGTGKTTHARLWRDREHALIINGDRAVCQNVNGIWTGFGLPWSGTSGEQVNRSVPLTALVVLERGEQNEAFQITGIEAFGAMFPHVQCPVWDARLTDKAMELTDDFLNNIPIIRLHCRPDMEAVDVLKRVLEEL